MGMIVLIIVVPRVFLLVVHLIEEVFDNKRIIIHTRKACILSFDHIKNYFLLIRPFLTNGNIFISSGSNGVHILHHDLPLRALFLERSPVEGLVDS